MTLKHSVAPVAKVLKYAVECGSSDNNSQKCTHVYTSTLAAAIGLESGEQLLVQYIHHHDM